ncbi:MAG: hypothetical protein AAF927_14445 [Bacteroidota bacterium]
MKNRKVFKLINSLQPKEKRKLDRWLEYELGEKQKAVHHLYKLLLKNAKVPIIWQALFPDRNLPEQPLQDLQLRRLENHLTERVSTFMAIEKFRKDESMRDLYLIKALNERPQEEVFVPEFNKIKKRIEGTKVKNGEYYQVRYLLEREYQYYRVKHNNKNYKLAPEYDKLLDTWWLHEKMRLANIMISRSAKADIVPSLAFALDHIEESEEYMEMPMLQIYWHQYKLHAENQETHIIPEWLWSYGSWLNPKEQRDILVNLTNFYTKAYNEQRDPYFREQLYLLLKWGIDQEIPFLDGYLPWSSYNLLCTLTFLIEPLEKSREIIETYKEKLSPKDQEEVYFYQLGNYYYRKKEFRNAIRILNQRFSRPPLERAGRILLLMCRYEYGDRVEIENEIRALIVWLERQSVFSHTVKQSNLNFLKVFNRLIQFQSQKDHKNLVASLAKEQNISNRSWLEKKIKELDSQLIFK